MVACYLYVLDGASCVIDLDFLKRDIVILLGEKVFNILMRLALTPFTDTYSVSYTGKLPISHETTRQKTELSIQSENMNIAPN